MNRATKTILLVDADLDLMQNILEMARDVNTNCNIHLMAALQPDGTWSTIRPTHHEKWVLQETPRNLLDIFMMLVEKTQTDINLPEPRSPICICPTACDCARPEAGNMSNECPIHNEKPQPHPDCPQHSQT